MLSKIDNYLLNKFGKREKMDINQYIIKYKTILAIIFFLNIEDAFVTLVAVRNLGTHELNPIMNALLSSPPGFIIVKKCSVIDWESVQHHNKYLGKRISRGLFRSKKGIIINSDGKNNILL